MQADEVQRPTQMFSADYVYFSSLLESWLAHARAYVEEAASGCDWTRVRWSWRSRPTTATCCSTVVAARNSLRRHRADRQHGPAAARARGIETVEAFFGVELARRLAAERRRADLMVGNNVFAHVPDINDFVAGLREALAPAAR